MILPSFRTRYKLQASGRHRLQDTGCKIKSKQEDKTRQGIGFKTRPNSRRKRRQDTTFKKHKVQDKTQARPKQKEKTKYKLQDKAQGTRPKQEDKTQDTSFKKRPKQEDKTRHKLQDKTQAGEMYGHGMPTSRPSSTLNIPSSTLNGPSSALNETHFPIYGENIDYAIKIVEHFINFLPVRGKLFLLVFQYR